MTFQYREASACGTRRLCPGTLPLSKPDLHSASSRSYRDGRGSTDRLKSVIGELRGGDHDSVSVADGGIQLLRSQGQRRDRKQIQLTRRLRKTVPLLARSFTITVRLRTRIRLSSSIAIFRVVRPDRFQIGRDEIQGFHRRPALDRHHAGRAEKKCRQLFCGFFARCKKHSGFNRGSHRRDNDSQ